MGLTSSLFSPQIYPPTHRVIGTVRSMRLPRPLSLFIPLTAGTAYGPFFSPKHFPPPSVCSLYPALFIGFDRKLLIEISFNLQQNLQLLWPRCVWKGFFLVFPFLLLSYSSPFDQRHKLRLNTPRWELDPVFFPALVLFTARG